MGQFSEADFRFDSVINYRKWGKVFYELIVQY